METSKIFLVICLTVAIVVGVNGLLLFSLRRKNLAQQFNLLRKASQRARQPWQTEDQALEELSRRVAELQAISTTPKDEEASPPPNEAQPPTP
jgi:hypothetical protein